MDSIYLDHNATTPMRPEVIRAMVDCYQRGYANPASQHKPGQEARKHLEEARERIAEILGADLSGSQPDRLILTGGGTEANCLAVLGFARAHDSASSKKGSGTVVRSTLRAVPATVPDPFLEPGQVIVSAMEHPSVIESAEHLLEKGWRLDTLDVTGDGLVRVERLAKLLTPEARVVSVMLANHDTGVLQPVAALAEICRAASVPIHTDAVQVAGKLPIDFRALGVDALSIAAHKFQGPLGIGALVLRGGVPIRPLYFGGHQQSGIRPGTESVALAVGMLTALELWQRDHPAHAERLASLRERFETGLKAGFADLVVNGAGAERLPHVSNVAFPGLDGQVLLIALDTAGVACSVGSACSSNSTELSPTLRAMQLPGEVVSSSIRFSLGATTTEEEIDEAIRRILHIVGELRC